MEFSGPEYWSGLPFPSPGESAPPRDRTRVSCVSCIAGRLFPMWTTRGAWKVERWRHLSALIRDAWSLTSQVPLLLKLVLVDSLSLAFERPRDCLLEWSKSEKDRCMVSLICGILKKKKNGTSEPIHKAQGRVTDAENSWLPSGERVGGVNWELGFCKQRKDTHVSMCWGAEEFQQ